MRRLRAAMLVAAAAMLLGGCDGADEVEQTVPDETAEPDTAERPDVVASLGQDPGEPPSELVVEDLVVGDGAEASPGDTVSVHYVGVSWSTQEEFDASWDRGQPFVFGLGGGQVIEGWDRGVQGMRVGGRRMLTIPPELGYGDRGVGGVIAAGETLVFVVDLLDVEAGS